MITKKLFMITKKIMITFMIKKKKHDKDKTNHDKDKINHDKVYDKEKKS